MALYSNEDYRRDAVALKAALVAAGVNGVELATNGERLTVDSLQVIVVTKGGGQYMAWVGSVLTYPRSLDAVVARIPTPH